MKYKLIIVLSIICVFIFSGCVKNIKTTDAEKELIAEYSANVLIKHSNYRNRLMLTRDELVEAEDKKAQEDKAREEYINNQKAASSAAENNKNNTNTASSAAENTTEIITVTATEAFAIQGLEVTANGLELRDAYSTNVFEYTVESGKKLVLAKFLLKNTTSDKLNVNILEKSPKFKLLLNNNKKYSASMTIAVEDLSTFKSDINPGEVVECVVFFSVPNEDTNDLSNSYIELSFKNSASPLTIKM